MRSTHVLTASVIMGGLLAVSSAARGGAIGRCRTQVRNLVGQGEKELTAACLDVFPAEACEAARSVLGGRPLSTREAFPMCAALLQRRGAGGHAVASHGEVQMDTALNRKREGRG